MRRRFPSAQIEVLSATPQATAAHHRRRATPRWDWRAIRAAIGRADVVLSGGGGLLQNATSLRSLLYYAAILREAIRARRKTMIFAQSIGPLDFWGRLVVRSFCKGLDRATVRDERSRRLFASTRSADPGRAARPIRSFSTNAREASGDLSAEGLGPRAAPYAVVSVRKIANFRDGPAIIARAVDRLAQTPRRARRVLAAGRRRRRRRVDRRHSRVQIEPGALARVLARESGVDSSRRARRHRDAFARADSGRALRGAVSRDSVRSEGQRALRRPGVSARTALARRANGAPRRRGRRAGRSARARARRARGAAGASAAKPCTPRQSETSTCSASCLRMSGTGDGLSRDLNLPKTDFPMKADLPKREPRAGRLVEGAPYVRTSPGTQRCRTARGSCTTGRRMPTATCTWATS